jgi:hypothetical protein
MAAENNTAKNFKILNRILKDPIPAAMPHLLPAPDF